MDRRYEELVTRGLYQFDKEALFELGVMCRDGVGVKQDTRGAEEWFVKAKMLGHPEAARALAVLRGEVSVEEVDPIIKEEEQPIVEEGSPGVEEEVAPIIEEDEPPVIEDEHPIIDKDEPPVIEREPPILKRKKEAPVAHPYCPHGHGQMRKWDGGMRCWTCGHVSYGSVVEGRPRASGFKGKSAGKEDSQGLSTGCLVGLLVGGLIFVRSCF